MRKVIGFDLDTKALEKYYPKASWRNAYDDIKKFMVSNGFEWKQGSIYVSKDNCSNQKTRLLVEKLVEINPWLNACMRDCIMADIGKKHSLNSLFDKENYLREVQKKIEQPKTIFTRRR